MSTIVINYVFAAGNTIIASQHNLNNSTIYNDYNGNIQNVNVASNAGIAYSKLNLSGSIVNADISSSAAIAGTKIASLSATQLTGNVPVGVLANGTATQGLAIISNGTNSTPSWGSARSFVPNSIQIFVSSTTWTQPAGVNSVYVKVIGGGGTGGNGINNTISTGGGGGSGGYTEGIIAVTGNVTILIGGTNSFAGSTTISATSGTAGTTATIADVPGGIGGTGTGGTINLIGQNGQSGLYINIGSNTGGGGNGGSSIMGSGGVGQIKGGGNGGNGLAYGGGGGGASGNGSTGGTGDPGAVIVYY